MSTPKTSSEHHGTKVLITGGTGFVGSHLVELLAPQSQLEIHVTSYGDQPSVVHDLLSADQIHQLDLTDGEATAALIGELQPDHLYHLASLSVVGGSFKQTQRILTQNLNLQVSLLEALAQHSPHTRTLIISSAEVYGQSQADEIPIRENHPLRPVNPYAVSKVAQDLLAFSYFLSRQLPIIRVRPFNHIGERQTPDFVVPAFAQQIVAVERGEQTQLKVGNLDAIRDFTDVRDMVRAYQLLMNEGEVGEVYNVGSGRGVSIREVLDGLCAQASVSVPITTDPERLRPTDVPVAIADSSKVESLGWQAEIPLSDTLHRILEYWRSLS